MRGKSIALASPMFAVPAARVCSASRMSGRRSRSSDGSPAGTAAGSFCSSTARPRRIGPGLRPRSTDSSFSLSAIEALEVEDHRFDALQLRLGLAEVHLGGDAALEAVLRELHVLAPGLDRAPGDLEPAVEVAQLEVRPGHVRDERQDRGAPGLLGAEKEGLLGFRGAPDAPEEIELPGHIGGEGVDRGLGGRVDGRRVALGRVDETAGVEAEAALRARVVVAKGAWRLASSWPGVAPGLVGCQPPPRAR